MELEIQNLTLYVILRETQVTQYTKHKSGMYFEKSVCLMMTNAYDMQGVISPDVL